MGVENSVAAQEIAYLARDFPDARNGGQSSRRGGAEHKRELCDSQFPITSGVPASPRWWNSLPPLSNKSGIDMAFHIKPHRVPFVYSPNNCCCRRIPLRLSAPPS